MSKKILLSIIRLKTPTTQSKSRFLAFFLTLLAVPSVCQAAAYMADESFGTRGEVSTAITDRVDRATAVVIQPDGKIVTAGVSQEPSVGNPFFQNFTLVRYNPDGTFDGSFGSGGKVITSFGYTSSPYNSSTIYDLAIQSDGKLVAAGASTSSSPTRFFDLITLVRYNADGSIDNSFGVSGKVIIRFDGFNESIRAVALQPTGKIVVVGYASDSAGRYYILTARFNTDGSLDTTFGTDGKVLTAASSGSSGASAVVIQPDAKIIVGGGSGSTNSNSDFALIRYTADGALDSSFGTNGIVTTAFDDRNEGIISIAVQSNGKIVVGGNSYSGDINYPALARYNTDGSLDSAFGTNGKVLQTDNNSVRIVSAIALQPDEKIVTAGATSYTSQVSRYHTNGTLDRSFGVNGRALSKVSSSQANDVAIQADGKIVIAGERFFGWNSNHDFMVARYVAGPGRSIAAYDFDGDGKSDVSLFRPSEGVWYLNQSTSGFSGAAFGAAGDKPVPADYDGDGKTDLAVYRGGIWYLLRSQAGFTGIQFGSAEDIPMPADFDDDGKTELAVYRPSNGYWYELNLVNNQFTADLVGQPDDQPVIVTISSSGYSRPQRGVFRNGLWHILFKNVDYAGQGFIDFTFGAAGDIPVPADYNGDGRTDLTVFRPSNGTWYFRNFVSDNQVSFGVESDVPVPADYDGDGKADVAVFRNGTWYINRTTDGLTGITFGAATDIPVPKAYIP